MYKNDYIDDYHIIKSYVTKKYGTPISDNIYWGDDLYKNNVSEWGFALSIGHLSYSTRWKIDDIDIRLTLNGDNCIIEHRLLYTHKELARKKIGQTIEFDLDDF